MMSRTPPPRSLRTRASRVRSAQPLPQPPRPAPPTLPFDPELFHRELLTWYRKHARDLPWRGIRNPYATWLSEIMLQQTRVAAIVDRYTEFLRRFPTLESLAEAKEEDVLALWSGLGYYRRAHLLHRAAQFVQRALARQLPRDPAAKLPRPARGLRAPPGVGEYTAAAIASIAFGEPVAVVDGNVERVLLRVFSDHELTPSAKWFREKASSLLDRRRPGDFNQAMMELGATVCLPQRPLCLHCPVHAFCSTRGEHQTLPPKKMRNRQIA